MDYVYRTWIRSSIFKIHHWSVFMTSIRTNNDVGGMAQPPKHQCCHQGIGSLLPSSSCSASGSDKHHSADEDGIWREDAEVPKEEDITGGRSCLQALEQLLWKIDHCEWTVKGLCFYLWTTSFEHVIRSDIVISTAVPPFVKCASCNVKMSLTYKVCLLLSLHLKYLVLFYWVFLIKIAITVFVIRCAYV